MKGPVGLHCHQIRLLKGSPTSNSATLAQVDFRTTTGTTNALVRTYTADLSGDGHKSRQARAAGHDTAPQLQGLQLKADSNSLA